MGSACCVAVRHETLSGKANVEDLRRNGRHYASRQAQWDHNGYVAGEFGYPSHHLHEPLNKGTTIEINGRAGPDRGKISAAGSPSQKSSIYEGLSLHHVSPADTSTSSRNFYKVKNSAESPEMGGALPDEFPCSIPSSSSFSTPTAVPFYSNRQLVSASTLPSKLIRHSPGHQLFRQVSDGRIQGLKSPNNNSLSEGRRSFVLSTVSNDLTASSHGGSSDGWSLRTFSELVASSQRERWSFDSAHFGSGQCKISGPSSRFSYSPSVDLQICGACLRPLAEKVSFFGPEFPVVAVLACAHAYHSECLETMTAEVDKYDPACPICAVGEKQFSKMSRKAVLVEAELKTKFHRTSRNRVMDIHFDALNHKKVSLQGGNGGSCSSKGKLGKQFFRRHFSLGSKWGRSTSANGSGKKMGFWVRSLSSGGSIS
ncbi:hypothetical protein Dimus_026054 [Dionaea muscipula]